MMKHADLIPYVGHVVDDALWGGTLKERGDIDLTQATLVSYQCGFEPMVVAAVSCLGGPMDPLEAEEVATDYLREIGWLTPDVEGPDLVVQPTGAER